MKQSPDQKSQAILYSERETRTKTSMRQEFGRLTDIVQGSITYKPHFTDRNGKVWTLHNPPGGLQYYYLNNNEETS